jgi:hypothetical protein
MFFGLVSEHDFTGYEKTGSAAKVEGFVSGHDFSRAANTLHMTPLVHASIEVQFSVR